MSGYAIRNDGLGWRAVDSEADCADDEKFSETQPDLVVLPLEQTLGNLSQYQFRMCLINKNMLDQVTTEIAAIEDDAAKLKVSTAFNYAPYFSRLDENVIYMMTMLGLSDDQANTLWQEALTL